MCHLTHKQLEIYGFIFTTVAPDALVLKQGNNIRKYTYILKLENVDQWPPRIPPS